MIKGSTARAAERVSIRSVLRGSDSAAPRASRRRTKALVGWLLYCCTAVGGTAAAFTVRDTLFPSLGAATKPAIWGNSSDTTLETEHGSSSTEGKEATLEAITVPATTASSIEAQTVPASSASSEGPGSSVDNRSPGDGPATGTTVVGPSSSGPGPGTTVDDHPTESSTPGSASTPTSADATPTSASTPGPSATDPGHQGGKGGGSGGGSPGGPPSSTP